jgi:hypothetical protein
MKEKKAYRINVEVFFLIESGHPSKGEGCYFILESRNKMSKKWLPPGAPKEKHWNQACRNLDKLEKVKIQFI